MANDYFQFQQFTVRQEHCAMKVGTDGTLLGAWANSPGENILDIGTGTGLIALMMAQRFPQAQVTGIDIDPLAVRQACENVAASPFADRITIVEGDIRGSWGRGSWGQAGSGGQAPDPVLGQRSCPPDPACPLTHFDAIVCNPPYFDASLESPDAQRTLARHTSSLSYRQLMASAWQLLSDDGELSVVIPFDCKARLEAEAILTGFHKVRTCAVHTTSKKPPRRFLMAFRKHSPAPSSEGKEVEVLVIGSEAYNELTKDFYLKK